MLLAGDKINYRGWIVGTSVSGKAAGMSSEEARNVATIAFLDQGDSQRDMITVSRHATPFFFEHRAALSLIRQVRWSQGYYCPRCRSETVRRINTCKVTEAYNCQACRYNFNSVSGTFFHGSKMPLDHHLQVLAAFDLFREPMSLRQLASFCGISYKTAKATDERLKDGAPHFPFIRWYHDTSVSVPASPGIREFFESETLRLDMTRFFERLRDWLFS